MGAARLGVILGDLIDGQGNLTVGVDLRPATVVAPAGLGVLTVEFKVNFVSPAAGQRLIARGRVVRPGRTITVTQGEVFAETGGERRPVALMTSTLISVEGRDGVVD